MNEFVGTPASRLETAVRSPLGLALRILLTALAILSTALIVAQTGGILPSGQLPFRIERTAPGGGYVVRERSSRPLPPPLGDGDVLGTRDMTRADRATRPFTSAPHRATRAKPRMMLPGRS